MGNWLNRTEQLIGNEKTDILKKKHVAIFGLGGVGSYVCEALVRAGIGEVTLIDHDTIDISNINRQLLATTSTVGLSKVEIAKNRYLDINPELIVHTFQDFYNSETSPMICNDYFDYIVDAIDTVSSKIHLIQTAKEKQIPIISCMGTGNKLDASQFKIVDIAKTSVCPLAKVMRKELKNRNIKDVKVLFSTEEPKQYTQMTSTPASISFVPSVAGLLIAGEVIKDLIF